MYYNQETNEVIASIYQQMAPFMSQYGGYAKMEENQYKTIYAFAWNGSLAYGYEFHANAFGVLRSIKCFGLNLQKEMSAMKVSRNIFGFHISRIDESNFPNSITVYL